MSLGGSKAGELWRELCITGAVTVKACDGFQDPDTDSKGGRVARARRGVLQWAFLLCSDPTKSQSGGWGTAGVTRPGEKRTGLNPAGPCPRLLPSVTTMLYVLLLTPPFWSSEMANNQSENGILFCLVNTFTFFEHAGAQLLNAHVFSIPWCLAVLGNCPPSPL